MDFVRRLTISARVHLPLRYAALRYYGVSFTDACGKWIHERLHFGDCTPHCPSYCSPSQLSSPPGTCMMVTSAHA